MAANEKQNYRPCCRETGYRSAIAGRNAVSLSITSHRVLAMTSRHSDRHDTEFAKVSVAIWSGIHVGLIWYAIVNCSMQEEDLSHIICSLQWPALIALMRLGLAENLTPAWLADCQIVVTGALAALIVLIVMWLKALIVVVAAVVPVDLTVE